MKVTSSKSILKQILAPILLVIVFWISMSLGTTYFLLWVERSNQRIFLENVVSTKAAQALQIAVWKLASGYPVDPEKIQEFQPRWSESKAEIENQRDILARSAYDEEEFLELAIMSGLLKEFFNCFQAASSPHDEAETTTARIEDLVVQRAHANELAERIGFSAKSLFDFNQAVVDEYRSHRKKLNDLVLSLRWLVLGMGPILGVILGWRVGSRLHRSMTRIAVTLHDAGSMSENDLGIIKIDPSGDFKDVEQQAEHLAERMRKVSRELHAARSEVLQSERLAAVGELAAGVAHEIRNPLTSVKLLLQHAIRQTAGPNLDESKVRLILDEIGRMETTIQGLLDFSRPPKLNRVHHDLRQTLHRAVNLLDAQSRQHRIEIQTRVSDTPLIVDGDTEKLHQLLVNLLINAVEAMPDGGHLSIEANQEVLRRNVTPNALVPEIGDAKEEPVVQVIIRDTGEGIASEVLSRLFEPFATTKERGTGLGLAVSHRIAEEHGGTICACNCPSGGAQFTLTIPMVDHLMTARSQC